VVAATGDIVTFEYENFSRKDAPVNPRVTRVRKDLTWEDTVRDFNSIFFFFLFFVSYFCFQWQVIKYSQPNH
jgi:hypothetical protein